MTYSTDWLPLFQPTSSNHCFSTLVTKFGFVKIYEAFSMILFTILIK